MESRRFVIPWLGESKWIPFPHAPPTSLCSSLPTLPKCPPPISPLLYTYIHPQTTFFPIPMPPFILYTSPAPLPPIFSHSPATSTLLHNYTSISFVFQGFLSLAWFTLLPYPCPPPPAPHFRFFEQFMDAFLHVFLFHSIYTCTYMIYCIE